MLAEHSSRRNSLYGTTSAAAVSGKRRATQVDLAERERRKRERIRKKLPRVPDEEIEKDVAEAIRDVRKRRA